MAAKHVRINAWLAGNQVMRCGSAERANRKRKPSVVPNTRSFCRLDLAAEPILAGDWRLNQRHHRRQLQRSASFVAGIRAGWPACSLGRLLEVRACACVCTTVCKCVNISPPPALLSALCLDGIITGRSMASKLVGSNHHHVGSSTVQRGAHRQLRSTSGFLLKFPGDRGRRCRRRCRCSSSGGERGKGWTKRDARQMN